MTTHNIVSVSGGKDSTATLLVATDANACSSAYGLCDSDVSSIETETLDRASVTSIQTAPAKLVSSNDRQAQALRAAL
ncbi:hypothetical protein HX823_06875 [Pseudomonas sp. P7759]|uniref:hypothetical protein n=1 Tax=Pseudomonas sp. P7759 TaxID=2738831 RepID=UPI0015A3A3C9|nr:hypothetical protein [Pseudomonas sp. P7759]NWC73802.1 hypothetical protein [Pseudomonas sp. P7759]